MTPIQKIDAVLKVLSEDATLKPFANDLTIFDRVSKLSSDFPSSLQRILDKLVKDKYLDFIEGDKKQLGPFTYIERLYFTSFEGDLFHQQGGYQGAADRLNADKIQMERLANSAKVNRNMILWLTIFVALGSIVAAWYYGIEIWKFYHPWGYQNY